MSNFKIAPNSARKTLLQSTLIAAFTVAAFAPGISLAQTQSDSSHWQDPQNLSWKNSTGLCWRSGSWTPKDATAECDPELMAKAAVPVQQVAVAPAPVVAAAPAPTPKAQARKVTFSAAELFDFDKVSLRPEGKAALDKLTRDLKDVNYETIQVTGHTDRLGSNQYNQKLSERRANAVNAYLIGNGIPDSRTTSAGMGETQPLTKSGDCKGPSSKKVITCLQPDRRVEVDVTGSKEVVASQ